jgi:hypothetical protein
MIEAAEAEATSPLALKMENGKHQDILPPSFKYVGCLLLLLLGHIATSCRAGLPDSSIFSQLPFSINRL